MCGCCVCMHVCVGVVCACMYVWVCGCSVCVHVCVGVWVLWVNAASSLVTVSTQKGKAVTRTYPSNGHATL